MGNKKPRKVLVIPDTHCPYQHPDAWRFLDACHNQYGPFDHVIHLGDELDYHAISFHNHDPDLLSPSSELEAGIQEMRPLYDLFPKVTVLESNHGSLVLRKLKHHGLPARIIKPIVDILEAPKGWVWKFEHIIDLPDGSSAYFHHGKSATAFKTSQTMGMHSAEGHFHGKFCINHRS